jgi:hypothetical protein
VKTFRVEDEKFSKIFSRYCNLETGPWIAGGSVRKLWEGKPWQIQDVDFFFRNPQQFTDLTSRINEFGKVEQEYKTNNASTYTIYCGPTKNPTIWDLDTLVEETDGYNKKDNWLTVQLVQKRWHSSAWQLINDFDLGLSQFVTDGSIILATEQAVKDATDGIIRANKNSLAEVTPMRLTKYCAYGFEPDLDLLKTVLKTTIASGFRSDDY